MSRARRSSVLPNCVAALAGTLLSAGVASADTVWLRSGQATNALEWKNVKVEKVENGVLTFRSTSSDRITERPLEDVARVSVDGENVFNQAEEAFYTGKWDAAATAYQRAIGTTNKQWIKDRASLRLVAAAEKSGKFSAAVAGWAALMARDPATAAKYRPQVPANAAPGSLGPAVAELDRALNDGRLKEETRKALLTFQLEVARANGDLKKAQSIGTRLTGGDVNGAPATAAPAPGGAATTTPPAGTRSAPAPAPAAAAPGTGGQNPALALQMAHLALDQRQYDKALKEITAAAAAFNEPEQQVEALYAIAEARAGLAADDPAALKDAALAYMRTVARAKSARLASPRLAESLMKTAAIQERLGAPQEALLLYQQVTEEFKGTEAATRAAQSADRIGKSTNKADTAASAS